MQIASPVGGIDSGTVAAPPNYASATSDRRTAVRTQVFAPCMGC
jgi:hypothetical protein